MNTKLNVNLCDETTLKIMETLRKPFKEMEEWLSQDYDGTMENLWIDFELSQIVSDQQPPFKFRFQKRISGKSNLSGIEFPDSYNVGHYSIRPNFEEIFKVENVITYSLNLIYESTEILIEKQKRLGGFDAFKFRAEFLKGCTKFGYKI
jgi:hypothetical protein